MKTLREILKQREERHHLRNVGFCVSMVFLLTVAGLMLVNLKPEFRSRYVSPSVEHASVLTGPEVVETAW